MARSLNALDLLRRDHEKVQKLFDRFEKAKNEDKQHELCEQIVSELRTHTRIEEQVFYPCLQEATGREDLFQEASIEHETISNLLDQLEGEQADAPRFQSMVKVLAEYVTHHVKEEEEEIFPQMEESDVDLKALGKALEACRNDEDEAGTGRPGGAGASKKQESPKRGGKGRGDEKHAGPKDANDGGDSDQEKEGNSDQEKEDARFLREHGDDLSRSTQHAKWIHVADDKPDHDGQTLATRNGEVIRAWAEARGGRPSTSPGGDAERPRVLRFDFPDYDKNLQPVSWEAWLGTFEERELVFLYQETMKAGNQSNFFRLDSPDREEG